MCENDDWLFVTHAKEIPACPLLPLLSIEQKNGITEE